MKIEDTEYSTLDTETGERDLNFEKMFDSKVQLHKFEIWGLESREFIVKSRSNTSAGINVPLDWQGKKVMVVRLE